VFTRTKHGANRLADQLEDDGINSSAIHGNKSQSARTKALADFKKGEVRVLVATDIAARGLDIDQLPHVVNYELPNVPEDYVHRIGRTGRAGKEGQAVSLVCVDEHEYLRDIERLLKRDIPKLVIEGFEPNSSIKAEPISHGRGQRGGGRPQAARQGGEHRRHQQPQSRSPARAEGPRPQSNQHARFAGPRPHSPPPARSTARHHANSRAPREEVDGNRRTSENTSNTQRRHDHYDVPRRSHQTATHSRPDSSKKPAQHRAKREVPALFEDGSKRGR
jgi:ATP-dependent RNA helicase RhlE